MKLKDVVIGQTYFTNVGSELRPVIVVGQTTNHAGKTVFRVANLGPVPGNLQPRSAAALRVEKKRYF